MRLLVVDANPVDRTHLRRLVGQFPERYAFDEASSGETAIRQIANERYRCVLLGNGLADMTAAQLVTALAERSVELPPIVLLCEGDDEAALRQCLASGAQDYLLKRELSVAALARALRRASGRQRLQAAPIRTAVFPAGHPVAASDLLASGELGPHRPDGGAPDEAARSDRWDDRERQQRVRHRLTETVKLQPFHLHYQPRYRAQTQQLEALEGLLRWDDAELGPVPPSAFIPICERNGMISLIGRVAVERAREDWQRHLDRIPADLPLKLSLNLSPAQLLDEEFLASLKDEAQARGSLRGRLQVEISDKAGVQNSRKCVSALDDLVAAGIAVAIDDFGAGSTSVAQLASMPVTEVILDAALTDGIAPDTAQSRRVGALIAMANALGIIVTAKRIESASQLKCLIALGCHQAQGNALSSPLAADELEQILRGAGTTTD